MRVYAALVLVQIIFGVNYFVSKLILERMSPRAWASLRVAGAALLLFTFNALWLRLYPRRWRDVAPLLVFALFGVVLNQLLFVEGLSRTTPSHSALINSLIPVMTLGFALVLRHESWTLRRVLSMLLAFASVLMLLGVENLRFDEAWVLGDLLTLANASSFSLFLVLSRDYLRRNHALASTVFLFAFGSVGMLAIGGRDLVRVDFAALPAAFWAQAAFVIVFATAVVYVLNYYALQHVESSMVALFIYLQAPIATLLSVALLGERPSPRFYLAAVGIFVGVFLAVGRRALAAGAPQALRAPSGRRPAKPLS